uniref:ShKT domain-containing protein n=1 Tax=Emiliania huxleyi TaxID=2903 RepID=A0A7S3RVM2_EMIHU|mmetsp:Transcript_13745/g.40350  ORF Transcript_13745/g.40350 Transcript_13745/m.40350 type:complete len:147 (+) Transcript_13745:61-501(+)
MFAATRSLALLLLGLSVGAAATEEENPFKEDGDKGGSQCYEWAADGQCKSNPGYMHDSCKYSCWEWFEHRRKAYPDAPIDKNFHCHNWAAKGECLSNRAFMTTTCPESCKDKYEDEKDEPPSKPPTSPQKKKKRKKKKKGEPKEEL